MELRNGYVIGIGIVALLVLFFMKRKNNPVYKSGKKFVGMRYVEEELYFKKKMRRYKQLRCLLIVSLIISIGASFILLARPYKTETVDKEAYNRDIILCMDISSSVDELNMELVETLKDMVTRLKGERFGIMIFNTTSVLLTPLTEDYEYVLETLDNLKKCLAYRVGEDDTDYELQEWLYLSNYITEGTLYGADERGSSLIADGLASAVYNFADLEEERTRIVIFTSDNSVQGTPLYTLDEAADLCQENNVVVYGIGTKIMLPNDMEEMEDAVIKTGGEFYLQEEAGTIKSIASEIEDKAKNLVKGTKEIREIETIEVPVILLTVAIFFVFLLMKQTRSGE